MTVFKGRQANSMLTLIKPPMIYFTYYVLFSYTLFIESSLTLSAAYAISMLGALERDGVFILLVSIPSALYGCGGVLLILKARNNIVKDETMAIYFAGAWIIGVLATGLGFMFDDLANAFFPCKGYNRCGISYTITLATFVMWFVQPYVLWHLSKRRNH